MAMGMNEEFQDKPAELPEWQHVLGIISRRRWHFLLPFFAGWLLVWGVSWFLPSVYRSGTLILVEQPAVPEKLVASNIDNDIQRQMDSISQQILSRTRLLQIIDSLNLYADLRKKKSPDELVEVMRKDVEIELSRGDDRKLSAFNIFYSNRDAKLAQQATNELANLFISESEEQRQGRSADITGFLQGQLDQARQKLAEQEARVREFKDKHIGELPSQTQSNLQILAGLQTQLQAQEDALNRARQQNTYLESLVSQYKTLDRGSKAGEGGPVGLAAIDKELDRLRAQLADLSARYTDKHPDVRKTKEQIASTEKQRERMAADISRRGTDTTADTSATPELKSAPMLELESQLKANRAELVNRQAAIREFEGKIGEYQSRLNHAPVMEQQFSDITRDYEQSKANYDSLLAKKNQSEMATDLEKTQRGEHFRMLDPANLPERPDKPNRLRLCGLGLLAGLIFGGAAAGAAETMSGKVQTEREIKKLVPFEILVEIPNLPTPAEEAEARRGAWLAGAAAAAILVVIAVGSAITYLRG
jgi:succinoglycan biosynthesis transport protein ExoP